MLVEKVPVSFSMLLAGKLSDYLQLSKFRLSVFIVFSAIAGFILASPANIDWYKMTALIIGGFFVTGASNGINQVFEKDFDKLMQRTANRPIPANRLHALEGLIFSAIMGVAGIFTLLYFINPLAGLLGGLALLLYTLAYTPLKRYTPFAVFVGAFPGAIPPLLGWVAATGEIQLGAWIVFVIQFIWQFPHFWAIAWVLDEDYNRAGFKMLPAGTSRRTAFQAMVYTAALIPVSIVPYFFNLTGIVAAILIALCGALFTFQAIRLFINCTQKSAAQLMMGSFIYLPVVLIILISDKFF
jgi:heme o synthase